MGLLELFDRVMILNLPSRPDRRREMRQMLSRVGWDPEGPKMTWFPAIDTRTAVGFPSPGSRGCFLSHIAVLNIAHGLGLNRVLVLEDDCEFAPDFREREAEVAGWLEATPWGIAYLGHMESLSGPPGLVPHDPGAPVMLTHCYAVAGDVPSRLAHYLEAITLRPVGSGEGGPMSIDAGFSWFRRHSPDVRTLLAAPSLAYQRASRSDLSARWFDRLPILSTVASQARVIRRSLTQARAGAR
jgi:glycosyl transferase family 25